MWICGLVRGRFFSGGDVGVVVGLFRGGGFVSFIRRGDECFT